MGAQQLEVEIEIEEEEALTPSAGGSSYRRCYEIATGGMATVFLAFPEGAASPDDAVALKQVHPHLATQRAFVEMFLDEARVTSQVDHPNVARVLDYGAEGGGYFLAMEVLHGCSLATVAKSLARQPHGIDVAAFAAYVVAEAADGLHAAHEAHDERGESLEIVHRDVSPHNLFVTYDGGVRVVDFGIASARGRLHHTEAGIVKGKFAYMAPEQMMGAPVDRRADVWSLGVVLFELIAGRPLFRRDNQTETVLAVTSHKRLPLALLPKNLSFELVEILERALATDPDERYATAAELARDLRRAMRRLDIFDDAELAAWMHALFPGKDAEELGRVRDAWADLHPPLETVEHTTDERSAIVRKPERPRPWARLVLAATALVCMSVLAGFALAVAATATTTLRAEKMSKQSSVALPLPLPLPDSEPAPAAAPDPAATPEPEPAPDPAPSSALPGRLAIATTNGWADVYLRGRHLGTTPGRFTLPAGRHVLVVRPHGGTTARRVPVTIRASRTARLRVDL